MASKKKIIQGLIDLGASPSLAYQAYAYFGDQAIIQIQNDPYQLLRVNERSAWETAEKLAYKNGMEEENPFRVAGAIRRLFSMAANDGHIFLPMEELQTRLMRLIGFGDESDFFSVLDELSDLGEIERPSDMSEIGDPVYSKTLHQAEAQTAELLAKTLKAPSRVGLSGPDDGELDIVENDLEIELAPAQREAVAASVEDKIVIITGGPGTGKTTIIRGALHLWSHRGARILLAAPTGRAAKRLAESTGQSASTIHRMLEYTHDAQRFNRNRARPLKCDLLVIDEASMIDIELMSNLLEALPLHTHLIFVGDVDQLPAVGPGLVLHDLIESECFRTICLKEIFRQQEGSLISVNAQKINRGEMPELDGLGLDSGQDFFFIPRPQPQRAQDTVVEMATQRIPNQFGLNPKTDIQILCPMIKKAVGVEMMNQMLQEQINPSSSRIDLSSFGVAVGEKLMQTKNDYTKDVFNGDIGFVTDINTTKKMVTIDYEGRDVLYHWSELINTTLAYAMTVHKSQGSEFPAVIIPILRAHYPMLQRNLLYTAVSRGKALVVLVGDPSALEIAVRNNKIRRRYTALKQRLNRLLIS
ncbi:MAG: AAA family ATPase [Candidatus Hinthialibacter antarcticus]|nr:AAA family ATPase [Candidatus Hinthialibacter antarcticus]